MTSTHRFDTADAARVLSKLTALRDRAAKRGFDALIDWTTTDEIDDDGDITVVIEITYGGQFRFDGGWNLVAVADGTATDEPLVFTFGDDIEVGTVDMKRCDHCGKRIARNKVLFVRNDDGQTMQVGGTCSTDFLGHDPMWATWVGEAIEPGNGEPTVWPVSTVIEAAITANTLGYRKASEPMSTREITMMLLTGKVPTEVRQALAAAKPAERLTVAEVRGWMRNDSGEGEFAANMRRVEASEWVTSKVVGIVAYAPAGLTGWRDKMAAEAARRAADEARRAEAQPVPVSGKRIRVEGVITSMKEVSNDFGTTTKVRVQTDAGWSVWGTLPSSIYDAERGDRVAFDASVTVSDNDPTFGFAARPSKAVIVERAAVTVA